MKRQFALITLTLATTLYATKSFAIPQEKTTPKICFERGEIENYKSNCEMLKANNEAMQTELQLAFDNSRDLHFYQTPGYAVGHAMLTFLLLFMVAQK